MNFTDLSRLIPSAPIMAIVIISLFVFGFAFLIIRQLLHMYDKQRLEKIINEKTRLISETAKKLSVILDSSPDAVMGLDRDGICTFLNRTGCDMLGYDRDEIVGKSKHKLTHYMHPDGTPYPEEDCPLMNVLTKGTTQKTHNHEQLIHRDGHFIPVKWTAMPIFEDDRIRPIGGVIFIQRTDVQKDAARKVENKAKRFHKHGK